MNEGQLEELNDRVTQLSPSFSAIEAECARAILDSEATIRKLLVAILAGGHVLLEGLPGLAKTLLAETFSRVIDVSYRRIQFTPDLLPADLTGGQIYNPKTGKFDIRRGPLFSQIVLADEINRASAKVQSALLESMGEKKISIAGEDFRLDEPYMVIATQNPIEQEGTYPLPEAQLDRFIFKLPVGYPSREAELEMLDIHGSLQSGAPKVMARGEDILEGRGLCEKIYADEKLRAYIVDIIRATRNAGEIDPDLQGFIEAGASPRASLALLRAGRAHAFLEGRSYVAPDDIRTIALDVLRHRVILTYSALAENIHADTMLATIIEKIPVP